MYREVSPLRKYYVLDSASALEPDISFKAQVSKLAHHCTQDYHSGNFLLQQDFRKTFLSSKYVYSTVPRRHLSVHTINVMCVHLKALLPSLSKDDCLLSQNQHSFLISILKNSQLNSHLYYCTLGMLYWVE